jgi:hypothetical protein
MISPQWLAGFFDGEGTIGMTVSGANRNSILRMHLVNTDYELLKQIQAEYGGFLTTPRPHKEHPNWKPFCSLNWTNRQAVELLDQIGDYIILKQKHVQLARQFLWLRNARGRHESGSKHGLPSKKRKFAYRVRPNIRDIEQELKNGFARLNRKGRIEETDYALE